jgi:hypothetical protein
VDGEPDGEASTGGLVLTAVVGPAREVIVGPVDVDVIADPVDGAETFVPVAPVVGGVSSIACPPAWATDEFTMGSATTDDSVGAVVAASGTDVGDEATAGSGSTAAAESAPRWDSTAGAVTVGGSVRWDVASGSGPLLVPATPSDGSLWIPVAESRSALAVGRTTAGVSLSGGCGIESSPWAARWTACSAERPGDEGRSGRSPRSGRTQGCGAARSIGA